MKKTLFFFLFVLTIFSVNTYAQSGCTLCTPDLSYTVSPAAPAMDPMTLPNATAGQPYNQVIKVYLPQVFHISSPVSTDVTLQVINVTAIIGMPTGMMWTKDGGGRTWTVNSTPASQHGCVTLCGTPLAPGTYPVTIKVMATVDAGTYGVQNSASDFAITLVVEPGSGGNAAFTMNPASGCDSVDVRFQALLQNTSEYPPNTYAWDFGNSTTGTGESPAIQHYVYTPLNNGKFIVTQSTTYYGYKVTSVSAHSEGSSNWLGCWSGWFADFNETCTKPDLFFNIEGTESSHIANDMDPTWAVNINLSSNACHIQFYDEDNVWFGLVQHADGGSADVTILPGPAQNAYPYNTGKVSGVINTGWRVTTVITTVDTVFVYPSPQLPLIQILPHDSVCNGETLELVSSDTINFIKWFLNSTEIGGEDSAVLATTQAGTYKLRVTESHGCFNENEAVVFVSPLPVPNPPRVWRRTRTNVFQTNGTGILQWYRVVGGMGEEIPGANADTLYLADSTQTSEYYITSTNEYGCTVQSNNYSLSWNDWWVGIDDVEATQLKVYPNPATDNIYVEFNNNDAIENMSLVNIYGQVVYNEAISKQGSNKIRINLNEYAKGVYTIILKSNKGNRISERFIVQ